MAVGQTTQPLLKSQPDMSKINAFDTGCHVTVTKHQGARNTPGTAVVPTTTMSVQDLLGLQVKLPITYGPGFYLFNVVDAGGSGEDTWMVRLGTDSSVPVPQEGFQMAGPQFPGGPFPTPMPVPAPLDADVKQIMPGWFYNEALGFLTTPWRETVSWRNGEPLPKPPATAGHLTAVPATATPWNWAPQQGGWGGYPVAGGSSSEAEQLRAELAEQKRQTELAEMRAEQRRRDEERDRREQDRIAEDRRREEQRIAREETRVAEDRRREEQRREEERRREEQRAKEMAELVARLTAKPAGPSEHEQRMERALEEEKRRREENERETQRKEEERRRDEQHRTELREVSERFERGLKEAATANKTDPVLTAFKEILTAQSMSSAQNIQTMKDAAAATAAVAERNAITPIQIFEMIRTARDGANESSKTVMDTMRGLMATQKDVFGQLIDMAGSGNQPWYAGAIQEGLNKVGMIGTAMAERNATMQAQQEEITRLRAAGARRPVVPIVTPPPAAAGPQLRSVPAGPAAVVAPTPPPPSPTPGLAGRAQHTGGRPEGTAYDKKREVFILADGREVAEAVVQAMGWTDVLNMPPYEPGAPALPTGRTAPAAPAALAAPAPTTAPAAAAPHVNGSGKKSRSRRGAAAAAPPAPEVTTGLATPAPPANGVGYTIKELRAMEPDQIRLVVNGAADNDLFGLLMPSIADLRDHVAKGLPADKAAEAILSSRQYLAAFGGRIPPAFELLMAEHYEVLVERLLPASTEDYRRAVAETLAIAIEAESGSPSTEGEDEEEGDGEGAEQ